MLIVAAAWIYVVGLMSLTEASFVAGIMTFLMYCVVPLSILFYLTGGRGRKRRADAVAKTQAAEKTKAATTATPGAASGITTTATTEATTKVMTKTTAIKDKQESQDDTR
jgi:cytochrome c biogenesis protein CcdA